MTTEEKGIRKGHPKIVREQYESQLHLREWSYKSSSLLWRMGHQRRQSFYKYANSNFRTLNRFGIWRVESSGKILPVDQAESTWLNFGASTPSLCSPFNWKSWFPKRKSSAAAILFPLRQTRTTSKPLKTPMRMMLALKTPVYCTPCLTTSDFGPVYILKRHIECDFL